MYKEWMLKGQAWNPLDGVWFDTTLYLDSVDEVKEQINKGFKIEKIFRLIDETELFFSK